MKKFIGITAALAMVCAVFSSPAMAAGTFDITAGYAKIVSYQGICERIGSITIEPKPATGSFWSDDTIITMELLGNDTLCKKIDVYYVWNSGTVIEAIDPAVWDYHVYGEMGDDKLIITIGGYELRTMMSYGANGEKIFFNHDILSVVCLNIADTPSYNPADPNNQRVQVSFRDDGAGDSDLIGTYTSDVFVATIKENPIDHAIVPCEKLDRQILDLLTPKEDLTIKLCTSEDTTIGQDQETTTECFGDTSGTFCFKLDKDANEFETGAVYNFTLKNNYPLIANYQHVWISSWALYSYNGSNTVTVANGTGTQPAENVIQEITFSPTFDDSLTYYFSIQFTYDCDAIPGTLALDFAFSKTTCGDSYETSTDIAVEACDMEDAEDYIERIFPYSTNLDADWWAGLALTNITDAEITVNLEIYEADGDKYTASVVVPAMGMTVQVATALAPTLAEGDDAAFGDERFWMKASSIGQFYGFYMMGDGAQAQGYLAPLNIFSMDYNF